MEQLRKKRLMIPQPPTFLLKDGPRVRDAMESVRVYSRILRVSEPTHVTETKEGLVKGTKSTKMKRVNKGEIRFQG